MLPNHQPQQNQPQYASNTAAANFASSGSYPSYPNGGSNGVPVSNPTAFYGQQHAQNYGQDMNLSFQQNQSIPTPAQLTNMVNNVTSGDLSTLQNVTGGENFYANANQLVASHSQQQLGMMAQYNYYQQQYQNMSQNMYDLQQPQIQYVPVSYQPTPIYGGNNQLENRNNEILKQIEYYFSQYNLKRDMYIRYKMDADGYFPLIFVSGFPRVQQYTNDLCLIGDVIRNSNIVELSPDGYKVRPRKNWQIWPMVDDVGKKEKKFIGKKANSC